MPQNPSGREPYDPEAERRDARKRYVERQPKPAPRKRVEPPMPHGQSPYLEPGPDFKPKKKLYTDQELENEDRKWEQDWVTRQKLKGIKPIRQA